MGVGDRVGVVVEGVVVVVVVIVCCVLRPRDPDEGPGGRKGGTSKGLDGVFPEDEAYDEVDEKLVPFVDPDSFNFLTSNAGVELGCGEQGL